MSTNFVSVNTGYQNRSGAPHARAARGGSNSTKTFSEFLNTAAPATAVTNHDEEVQAAVYSVAMNWLENKRIMSEKPKTSVSIKPISIVSGYCLAANYQQ